MTTRKKHPLEYLLAAPVLMGLFRQGHIPTIEQMLAEKKTWKEIGDKIGWEPETAERHYGWYLEHKEKHPEDKGPALP